MIGATFCLGIGAPEAAARFPAKTHIEAQVGVLMLTYSSSALRQCASETMAMGMPSSRMPAAFSILRSNCLSRVPIAFTVLKTSSTSSGSHPHSVSFSAFFLPPSRRLDALSGHRPACA